MGLINFILYTAEEGKVIRVRTYNSDITTASTIFLRFKRPSDGTTASLTANYVSGDTTYYAVDASITTGWLTAKAGRWTGQVEANWSGVKAYSTPFTMTVRASPSV